MNKNWLNYKHKIKMEEAKKNFNLIFNKLDNDYDLLNIKIKKLKKKTI